MGDRPVTSRSGGSQKCSGNDPPVISKKKGKGTRRKGDRTIYDRSKEKTSSVSKKKEPDKKEKDYENRNKGTLHCETASHTRREGTKS